MHFHHPYIDSIKQHDVRSFVPNILINQQKCVTILSSPRCSPVSETGNNIFKCYIRPTQYNGVAYGENRRTRQE